MDPNRGITLGLGGLAEKGMSATIDRLATPSECQNAFASTTCSIVIPLPLVLSCSFDVWVGEWGASCYFGSSGSVVTPLLVDIKISFCWVQYWQLTADNLIID